MSRLWSRFSLRVLSIMILILGLIGGAYLSYDRQAQQRATAAGIQKQTDLAFEVRLQQRQAALFAAQAPAIAAAMAAAKQKAADEAAKAAAAAKKAEDAARAKRAAAVNRSTNRVTPKPPSYGPIPSSCGSYTGNRALGCSLLLKAGFGLSQMPCLDKMWTHESNWRTTAENPSSHSYGIPQSLPAGKMAAFGSDYRSNPVTQIKWGLDYITKRYHSPCQAWSFWQGHNFY